MKAPNWPPVETEPAVRHPEAPPPGTVVGPHYSHCFGCGDEQEHGLHLRSTAGAELTLSARFTVSKAHQGAPGLAHGGLLACAFDEALGTAVGHLIRQPTVTGHLQTDFVAPVPVGSTLHIACTVQGIRGRRVFASADGRLDAEDGPVAVRARAIFVIVPFTHFTEHGSRDELEALAKDPSQRYDINP
jgi:acyl-coenzyme A thioesterase PaaI-like protein